MSDTNFADYIEAERARIQAESVSLRTERHNINLRIDELEREALAITAYEQAKAGKPAARRRTHTNGPARARPNSKRAEIISLVGANPQGLGRGDLLELMLLKGNKSGEMSVSNALTALIKNGSLARNELSKYVLA